VSDSYFTNRGIFITPKNASNSIENRLTIDDQYLGSKDARQLLMMCLKIP